MAPHCSFDIQKLPLKYKECSHPKRALEFGTIGRASCQARGLGVRHRQQVAAQSKTEEQTECKGEEDFLPKYEDETEDTDFFPKRQPGRFPNFQVRNRLQAALGKLQTLTASPEEQAEAAEVKEESGVYDPLRDGPLRYLGYANEVGEAFGAWLPIWGVPASYAVAIGYVLTDTADKGNKAYKEAKVALQANDKLHPEVNTPKLVTLLALERTLDTVIWQLLASVACPGYTIHTVVALFHAALKPIEETPQVQQLAASAAASLNLSAADFLTVVDKSLPTAAGLAAIPFIVHPIDNGIHGLLNFSLRPAMRRYVCGPGQGSLAELEVCGSEECVPLEAAGCCLLSKNSIPCLSQKPMGEGKRRH